MTANGDLILPSGRLLRYYKNSVHQAPGVTEEMLNWMFKEAEAKEIPAAGRYGCIALDEMKIQVSAIILFLLTKLFSRIVTVCVNQFFPMGIL